VADPADPAVPDVQSTHEIGTARADTGTIMLISTANNCRISTVLSPYDWTENLEPVSKPTAVIPAQAGIQSNQLKIVRLDSRLRGNDGFETGSNPLLRADFRIAIFRSSSMCAL
jgi:hypothetical protein